MRTIFFRLVLAAIVMSIWTSHAIAQTARVAIQAALARLVPNGTLPDDLIVTGQLTDFSGVVQPFQITIKGKDQVKYEVGSGSALVTTSLSKGVGWRNNGRTVETLQPYSAMQRPAVVPFFDLLAEASAANLQVTDKGLASLGTVVARWYTLKLPDPSPTTRMFRRALDEDADFYVDPVTLLIVRSARSLMAENSMDVRFRSSTDFSDYRLVQGLSIPFRIVETVTLPSRAPFQSVYVVANVTVNSGVSDSVFTFQGTRR